MRDDLEIEIHRTRQRGWSEDHVKFHPDSTCCGAVIGWNGVGRRLPRPAAGQTHCCCRVAPPRAMRLVGVIAAQRIVALTR
jgi:hypothetical protein